jgi:hypothetical protein
MGKLVEKRRIVSSKKAEEMQEKYFAEHPQFYLSKHFCPIHAWKSCQKKHSDEVIAKAKLANTRTRQIELIIDRVKEVEESVPDLDEDFDAHMAAIEAEEAQTAKDWNDWNDGLVAASDEEFNKAWGFDAAASKQSRVIHTSKHHLQPFTFKVGEQEYTLYGSAFSDRKSEPKAEKAGVCAFLDHRWMKEYSPVWVNPALAYKAKDRFLSKNETPTIFLDWPDMGVLEIEDLKPVVSYLANVIDIGVEIGCMGGHGRTGTLMALIMVQLGCKAEEAIKTIRKDYCNRAIETQCQEDLIKAFAEEVQG